MNWDEALCQGRAPEFDLPARLTHASDEKLLEWAEPLMRVCSQCPLMADCYRVNDTTRPSSRFEGVMGGSLWHCEGKRGHSRKVVEYVDSLMEETLCAA